VKAYVLRVCFAMGCNTTSLVWEAGPPEAWLRRFELNFFKSEKDARPLPGFRSSALPRKRPSGTSLTGTEHFSLSRTQSQTLCWAGSDRPFWIEEYGEEVDWIESLNATMRVTCGNPDIETLVQLLTQPFAIRSSANVKHDRCPKADTPPFGVWKGGFYPIDKSPIARRQPPV